VDIYILADDPIDPNEVEDPRCPVIKLTQEQIGKFRAPWKHALIIKMLSKGAHFIHLQRRLRTKWSPRGISSSLISNVFISSHASPIQETIIMC